MINNPTLCVALITAMAVIIYSLRLINSKPPSLKARLNKNQSSVWLTNHELEDIKTKTKSVFERTDYCVTPVSRYNTFVSRLGQLSVSFDDETNKKVRDLLSCIQAQTAKFDGFNSNAKYMLFMISNIKKEVSLAKLDSEIIENEIMEQIDIMMLDALHMFDRMYDKVH